ncbi:hypothetical protein ETAA8_20720 [Anatilimnocola aggregata]|uniref:GHMP kinase C-terminal domain-containing protein n=1 Tax=Anatilimnocola aggregata TaxID=2528021 RepID=A0A517Y9U4_9BACT|nr:hypothetical protein [Anatilimnocola aggregata]QDU26988.1 hypothetical protein ETAA8_20720 [Anatilimnocola aggregata]
MPRQVLVTAPSRLHFGLFALAASCEGVAHPSSETPSRSYGGVGVMISQPGIQLRVQSATAFAACGQLAERAASFARRWAEFYAQSLDDLSLEVLAAPPDHVGLGTGTQLGLAISAGLTAFRGLPVPQPDELARSVGRGLRSAVGAYGFSLGGMIVDRGKLPGEFLSPLDCRLALPETWRFVLVRPLQGSGLTGACEQQAMDQANRNLAPLSEQLITEARESLVPAAALGQFDNFAASLGRYCELAGQFYTSVQGGPYNGPVVTALAVQIRALGHVGLGQSSWGPTLFVACPDATVAQELADQLRTTFSVPLEITITSVYNHAALIE